MLARFFLKPGHRFSYCPLLSRKVPWRILGSMMNYAKTKAVRTFLILGVAVVLVFAVGIETTFSARSKAVGLNV